VLPLLPTDGVLPGDPPTSATPLEVTRFFRTADDCVLPLLPVWPGLPSSAGAAMRETVAEFYLRQLSK
jgi:hypothetical protein